VTASGLEGEITAPAGVQYRGARVEETCIILRFADDRTSFQSDSRRHRESDSFIEIEGQPNPGPSRSKGISLRWSWTETW